MSVPLPGGGTLEALRSAPDAPATILVVDDSPHNRFAVRRTLERGGFEVWEADSGADGLARAAEDPDLILLDVNLPDISGLEVCRRLKTGPGTAHIPVLHVSHSDIDDAARMHGLNSGADAYLTEPVGAGVLLATTNALLRMRRAEDLLRRELAAAERLRRLVAELADAVSYGQVVQTIARQVVSELGARDTSLYVLTPARDRIVLAHSTLPEQFSARHAAYLVSAGVPAAEVIRTGAALFGDTDGLETRYPLAAATYRRNGGGAWVALPLAAYGRTHGSLILTYPDDAALDPGDQAMLLAFSERCAQALERASLYERQAYIASTLQSGLLPRRLPEIPGLELGARYQAGSAAMDVGGDFYDAFAAGDEWLVVVGDVCGHGPEAAALTSFARHTIRAEARHGAAPGQVLTAVHDALFEERDEEAGRFVTAACVRLRRGAHGVLATAAVAGHPAPLVLRHDGRVETVESRGPLLGYLDDFALDEVELRLAAGDALVLYTDGVTEARRDGDFFGEERLRARLGELATGAVSADRIADELLKATLAHAGEILDDVAILVIRVS